MWEDGCDNGYLGGEQSERLHQGKAGYSLEGEWWTHTYTHFKTVLQNSLSALLVCLFPGELSRLTSQHVSDQPLVSLSLPVSLFCTLVRHHALHPKTFLLKPPSQLFSLTPQRLNWRKLETEGLRNKKITTFIISKHKVRLTLSCVSFNGCQLCGTNTPYDSAQYIAVYCLWICWNSRIESIKIPHWWEWIIYCDTETQSRILFN